MFNRKNQPTSNSQDNTPGKHPFIKRFQVKTTLDPKQELLKKVIQDLKNQNFVFSFN